MNSDRRGDWHPPCVTPHRFACRTFGPPGRQICKVEIADAISSSHRTCRCCGLYARVCPLAAPLGTSSAALPSHRPAGFGLRPHPPDKPADSGIPYRRGQSGTPLGCKDRWQRISSSFSLRLFFSSFATPMNSDETAVRPDKARDSPLTFPRFLITMKTFLIALPDVGMA